VNNGSREAAHGERIQFQPLLVSTNSASVAACAPSQPDRAGTGQRFDEQAS